MRGPGERVEVARAKGRPMLSWVGKRPLREVRAFPSQLVERFAPETPTDGVDDGADWSDWPERFDRGGLLLHGDHKKVLAHLLATGFRGKVDLVHIDPPFDSGADYVRMVQLCGASGSARPDGETYTPGEQIQYADIWANDTYLKFMYERLLLVKELLAQDGSVCLHCDVVVGPGRELSTVAWLDGHNRHRPINRIRLIDLRTDEKHGRFFEHTPASARVTFERADGRLRVKVDDIISPSILERLAGQEGVRAPRIDDWRSMVDSVAIDTAYDGTLFYVDLIDIPERRSDLVEGHYELGAPHGDQPAAVRITDMLGEEILVVEQRS